LFSFKSSQWPQVHLNRTNRPDLADNAFTGFMVPPHTEHFDESPFMVVKNRMDHAARHRNGCAFERTVDQFLKGSTRTSLNPRQPRFVPLALGSKQRVHLLGFGAGEQAVRRKHLLANTAPAGTAAVNNRIA